MTQKMAKKLGFSRATLADIQREMAKPRLAESVREAVELAEEEVRAPLASGPREKHKD